jgi:hypothetical protein
LGSKIFCKIDGKDIPLVTTGTSPFIGAGQFGYKGLEWRQKFLNNPDKILEILETSYQAGARGIEVIPTGKILETAKIMKDTYSDYVITGSTYPGIDPKIEALIENGAKLIFVHAIISDRKDSIMTKLLDAISNRGIIPGIATHEPVSTIRYVIENNLNVRVFLIPFNANRTFMGNAKELEEVVDNTKEYHFIGMKTLAAGAITPKIAFNYISKHNITAVTIGMVTKQQAEESTNTALRALSNRIN